MNPWNSPKRTKLGFVLVGRRFPATTIVKASAVDSPESSSNFAKRMDQAWIISQVRISRDLYSIAPTCCYFGMYDFVGSE